MNKVSGNNEACKRYYYTHREQRIEHVRKWRETHPEKSREYNAKRRSTNPEAVRAEKRRDRELHADRCRETDLRYRVANKERIAKYHREKQRRYRANRPDHRLLMAMRMRVYNTLPGKRGTKSARTMDLVGCTIEALHKHLESLFALGMTWQNYGRGGWVVDHIRPCSSFDLSDPVHQQACFHFTNLQPLWEKENLKKGARRGITA